MRDHITIRQKLILFLIDCEPGIRDIYRMVKIYDQADFPSNMTKNLKPLLEEGFIYISKTLITVLHMCMKLLKREKYI